MSQSAPPGTPETEKAPREENVSQSEKPTQQGSQDGVHEMDYVICLYHQHADKATIAWRGEDKNQVVSLYPTLHHMRQVARAVQRNRGMPFWFNPPDHLRYSSVLRRFQYRTKGMFRPSKKSFTGEQMHFSNNADVMDATLWCQQNPDKWYNYTGKRSRKAGQQECSEGASTQHDAGHWHQDASGWCGLHAIHSMVKFTPSLYADLKQRFTPGTMLDVYKKHLNELAGTPVQLQKPKKIEQCKLGEYLFQQKVGKFVFSFGCHAMGYDAEQQLFYCTHPSFPQTVPYTGAATLKHLGIHRVDYCFQLRFIVRK